RGPGFQGLRMFPRPPVWLTKRAWCLLGLALAGCVTLPHQSAPPTHLPAPPLPPRGEAPAGPAACPAPTARLAFEAEPGRPPAPLLDLAAQSNPDVASARARAAAARGKLIQAGLYPNPLIHWHADQMGQKDNAWGEQGMTITQTFVTAGKLRKA